MRRAPVLALLTIAALAAVGLAAVPAQAAAPIKGRIIDVSGAHPPAVGMHVRLRALASDGSPGAIVDTDVTDSNGRFSLDAGTTPEDEYYVQVVPGRYQGGWVGGSPRFVQPRAADANTWAPGTAIGTIRANPAFMRGVVVDSVTHHPLRGIRVSGRSHSDHTQPLRTDTTDRNGVFVLTGLECEDDCFLRVNGAARGYEVGFRACNGTVVPTWGAACAAPLGRIGKVRLDHE